MKIVDLHCDTLDEILARKNRGEHYNLYRLDGHLDIERMLQSDYLLQCFAAFVYKERVASAYEQGKALAQLFHQLCAEYSPYIAPIYFYQDIARNAEQGLMSAMLTIEEGGVLEGSLTKLKEFYELGVRLITLTWNFPNEIGFPGCLEEQDIPELPADWKVAKAYPGLTEKGVEIVEMMEAQGILIDVSHLSDAGFWDVATITHKPFVASHSNARSVCAHKRNLTDAQIRMLAERGGVMGINFAADFLENDPAQVSLDSFIRHIKHILNVGGADILALGSDFDGITTNPAMPHAGCLPELFTRMADSGIPSSVIDKMQGENALRVMKEVLK